MPDRTTETTPGERRRRFELLARERAGDKSVLWRVGAWSGVAIASAVVAAVVANSPTGARHGALLAANSLIADQHKQLQQFVTVNEREARRLANAVETLNSDRNRLFKRVTDLEQNLDTVTGSVNRFASATPAGVQIAPPPANVSAPATQPATEPTKPEPAKSEPAKPEAAKAEATKPEASKPLEPAKTTPAAPLASKAETSGSGATPKTETKADIKIEAKPDSKVVAAASTDVPKIEVIRVEPTKSEPTKNEAAKLETAKAESAKVEATKADVPKLDPAKLDITKPETARPEPVKPQAAKLETSKPDASKPETLKPESLKSDAPKVESSKADEGTTGTVNQTQFGIDLGHASSIEGLRAIWAVTRKTHGALVDGLQPLISVREQNNGMGMQLRLVAGPMTDAAAAAILCAKINDDDRPCRTAVYDGQRLALRGDTAMQPDTATPSRSSRPARGTRPERKPKAEAKSSGRFNFPGIFSQP